MKKLRILAALAASAALALTACSPAENDAASSGKNEGEGQTVSITHALGTTKITGKPKRVATVGWNNQEVPLALGIQPVGMPKAAFGDADGDGMVTWVKQKVEELGGEKPVLFDETDGIQFEKVADTKPDVILAAYSGLTKEDYEKLSKIAPTVAYPNKPWNTTMKQMVTMDSKALGMEKEGKQLLADLDKEVDQQMAKHPNLKGKKVLFTAFGTNGSDLSKVGFYVSGDPRADILEKAGMGVPDIVKKYSGNTDSFYKEVSSDKPEMFSDVDLIVTYGPQDDPTSLVADMQKHPLVGRIPAVKAGHVAVLKNDDLGAAANPSPLGLQWGFDKFLDLLDGALK